VFVAAWIPDGPVQAAQHMLNAPLPVSFSLRLESVHSQFGRVTTQSLANGAALSLPTAAAAVPAPVLAEYSDPMGFWPDNKRERRMFLQADLC
jgi:hypothetical protein